MNADLEPCDGSHSNWVSNAKLSVGSNAFAKLSVDGGKSAPSTDSEEFVHGGNLEGHDLLHIKYFLSRKQSGTNPIATSHQYRTAPSVFV